MKDDNLPTAAGSAASLERMMALAVEQGEQGVAALERLVALQERAQATAAQAAYAAALAAFQASVPSITRNAQGAHGARYATLDHILDSVRLPLAEHGLAVTFDSAELDNGRLSVACIVHHALGHSERSTFVVSREAPSKRMNDTQRDGSALSYGRRYALCQALGLSSGDRDDDGAAASAGEPITADQAADLESLADEVNANKSAILRSVGVASFADFPAARLDWAVKRLEAMRA